MFTPSRSTLSVSLFIEGRSVGLSLYALNSGILLPNLIVPALSSNILITTLVITPSFLTLAGRLMYIGVVKLNCATSISLSVPIGIDLELKFIVVSSTTVKLLQST